MPAHRAVLARMFGVNPHDPPTSFFRFVGEDCEKLGPKSPRKACATHPTFQNIRAWPLGCEGEAQGGRAENLDCSPCG